MRWGVERVSGIAGSVVDNWANIAASGIEFIVVLLCIYGVFGEKFKVNRYNVLLIMTDMVVFFLIWEKILPQVFAGIIYVAIFVYCIKLFKRKFIETIGLFVLSFAIVGAIEIISAYIIVVPLEKRMQNREVLMLMANIMSFLISFAFLVLTCVLKENVHFIRRDNKLIIMIIICGLCMLFMLIDYRYFGGIELTYFLIYIVLIIVIYFYLAKMQKVQLELEKKKIELNLQNVYGNAYSELISEVRRRQHDFKNQLSVLHSMHLTATSLEDLIEKQKEYSDVLMENCRYDKILTGCNNSILAGYLYYKCVILEKSHVVVEYKVAVDTAECSLPLHEIIELLGILLTNAFESVIDNNDAQKTIHLTVEESPESLVIKVANDSPYVTNKEIKKFFEEGYSSKGENRGIGLARVKQLMQKCGAAPAVENHTKLGKNQVCFRMVIPK